MSDLRIIRLNRDNAAPFAGYLLPQIRQDMTEEGRFLLLGAVDGGHAVGAVAADVVGGEVDILSLYVDKRTRRQGVGSALLRGVGQCLAEADIHAYSAKVNYMVEEEDNEAIAAFLAAKGFSKPEAGQRLVSVDTAKIHRLPVLGSAFSSSFREDPHIRPYSAITPAQLKEIEDDPAVPTPLKPSSLKRGILRQAATIWVEDGHVLAWLIGYQGFDGGIVMSAACKREGAPKGCFRKLLLASTSRCYLMLGHDFTVYISTMNDHAGALVETLAGGVQTEFAHYQAETEGETPRWLSGEAEPAKKKKAAKTAKKAEPAAEGEAAGAKAKKAAAPKKEAKTPKKVSGEAKTGKAETKKKKEKE